ncbi:MAG: hypothetical protein KF845_16160 [Cyclobacteriaceae bacterium]|nr:hypothetical protein [Cyclobacteriaceae bacterium]
MGTIIDIKEEDYFNLLQLDKLTFKLKDFNSYAPTNPQVGEVVIFRFKNNEINTVVTDRDETSINSDKKEITLKLKKV